MTDPELLPWTRAVLTTTPARWLTLTETLPAELLDRPPAVGEWSALACLQHLVDTERLVFPARVNYLLAGQDFPAFDPDRVGSRAPATPFPPPPPPRWNWRRPLPGCGVRACANWTASQPALRVR
jgi:hypothetical protein